MIENGEATPRKTEHPAIFFDRDGVLNVDTGYPHRPNEIALIPGARRAVARAKSLGYLVIVVTNQSGVARGFFSEADVDRFNDRLNEMLSDEAGAIDAFYSCPYHPQATIERYRLNHPDRKPQPGMIERAISDQSISRAGSLLIGDKPSDIEAAYAAGIPGYLYQGGDLEAFLLPLLPQTVTDTRP